MIRTQDRWIKSSQHVLTLSESHRTVLVLMAVLTTGVLVSWTQAAGVNEIGVYYTWLQKPEINQTENKDTEALLAFLDPENSGGVPLICAVQPDMFPQAGIIEDKENQPGHLYHTPLWPYLWNQIEDANDQLRYELLGQFRNNLRVESEATIRTIAQKHILKYLLKLNPVKSTRYIQYSDISKVQGWLDFSKISGEKPAGIPDFAVYKLKETIHTYDLVICGDAVFVRYPNVYPTTPAQQTEYLLVHLLNTMYRDVKGKEPETMNHEGHEGVFNSMQTALKSSLADETGKQQRRAILASFNFSYSSEVVERAGPLNLPVPTAANTPMRIKKSVNTAVAVLALNARSAPQNALQHPQPTSTPVNIYYTWLHPVKNDKHSNVSSIALFAFRDPIYSIAGPMVVVGCPDEWFIKPNSLVSGYDNFYKESVVSIFFTQASKKQDWLDLLRQKFRDKYSGDVIPAEFTVQYPVRLHYVEIPAVDILQIKDTVTVTNIRDVLNTFYTSPAAGDEKPLIVIEVSNYTNKDFTGLPFACTMVRAGDVLFVDSDWPIAHWDSSQTASRKVERAFVRVLSQMAQDESRVFKMSDQIFRTCYDDLLHQLDQAIANPMFLLNKNEPRRLLRDGLDPSKLQEIQSPPAPTSKNVAMPLKMLTPQPNVRQNPKTREEIPFWTWPRVIIGAVTVAGMLLILTILFFRHRRSRQSVIGRGSAWESGMMKPPFGFDTVTDMTPGMRSISEKDDQVTHKVHLLEEKLGKYEKLAADELASLSNNYPELIDKTYWERKEPLDNLIRNFRALCKKCPKLLFDSADFLKYRNAISQILLDRSVHVTPFMESSPEKMIQQLKNLMHEDRIKIIEFSASSEKQSQEIEQLNLQLNAIRNEKPSSIDDIREIQAVRELQFALDTICFAAFQLGESDQDRYRRLLEFTHMETGQLATDLECIARNATRIMEIKMVEIAQAEKPAETTETVNAIYHPTLNWMLDQPALTHMLRLEQISKTYCRLSRDSIALSLFHDLRKYRIACRECVHAFQRIGVQFDDVHFLRDSLKPDEKSAGTPILFINPEFKKLALAVIQSGNHEQPDVIMDIEKWGFQCNIIEKPSQKTQGWIYGG